MKNSLFCDLVQELRNQLRRIHLFSINNGGFLTKEQKEKLKVDFSEMVNNLPEYDGNRYKFPEDS